jgi:hypothetical protein
MNKSETTVALFTALSKAQSQVNHAQIDSTNPHFRNEYASLESCIGAIKPALAENGLSLVQCPDRADNGDFILTSIITHASGEWISFSAPMILSKNDMQGLGSAVTYQRRYSLQSLFGIGDTDDDGNGASKTNDNKPKDGTYRIPFGKHKGLSIAEVGIQDAYNYATWLHQDLTKKGQKPTPEAEEFFAEVKKARGA